MSSLAAAVLEGDLVGWTGLPPALDEPQLKEALPVDWTVAPLAGERVGRRFGILSAPRAGAAAELEAWTPVGTAIISSLEFRPADPLDTAAILADLGDAELIVRSRQFAAGALVSDHVHAARGITIAVAEPLADQSGAQTTPYIVFVQLYEPTDTTTFMTRVGQSGVEPHAYPA